jgi:hypothetical protein
LRNEVDVGRTTDNEKSFELALTWIYNCLENHEYCNRSLPLPENRILPGRLIDVGDWPNAPPRLCATDGLPLETNYTTLSHCWSSYMPLRLTTSTLEDFQDHLDISALPQTFKDAIKITATLGIQYLWIDSLCIIQDSEQDWTEQAALMGDIYHNSWCNIAATAARDARDGCFRERNTLAVRKCLVEANWNSHPQQTLSCSSFDSWDNSVSNTLLHSRAWVVQELVLAPRVLHFGEQLYWECLEQRASETFPTSLPSDRRTKTSLDVHSLRHEWNLEKSLKLNRYLLWNLFVKRYSECDLTKPELDKLVAISGLARKLIVDGDQYVAGLWREILPHQLMWSVQDPGTGTEDGNSYIPSWSWASLNRRVKMHAPSEIAADNPILIRIISVEIPLLGRDPFGQIKGGGVLRLEGPLVKTTIRRCIEDNRSNEKWWLGTALAVVKPDRGSFADGTPVFCLTIEDALSFGSKVGIVLEPTGKLPGQFYRRGRFTVFDVKAETRYVQEFVDSHQLELEPEEYEDKLGIDPSPGLPFYRISLV